MSNNAKKTTNSCPKPGVSSDDCTKVVKNATSGKSTPDEGGKTERNKSSFAWSVVSESGERIIGESVNGFVHDSDQNDFHANEILGRCGTIPFSKSELNDSSTSDQLEFTQSWELADLFADKHRTFDPDVMLRKLEADRVKLEESFVRVEKKPTAAFRPCLNNEEDGVIQGAIGVPHELLQAGSLLSDRAISETLRIASGCVSSRMKTIEEVELDELVDLWTTLPKKTKKRILGIARKK